MDPFNRIFRILGCLSLAAVILFLSACGSGTVYETEELSDYGRIEGNYLNDSPAEFIHSFFPEVLEDCFSDVRYHYKAIKIDQSACEAWLEFTITDPAAFDAFLTECAEADGFVPFREGWMELPVASALELLETEDGMNIEYAEMGKILYRESDRRIIFWAMYVFDGGGTESHALEHFFTYFDIDPVSLATEIY